MDYSSKEYFDKMTAWWRAANYLSVGQLYLKDNPLLRRTLKPEDVKKHPIGHWGTIPGQNFIYVHLNFEFILILVNIKSFLFFLIKTPMDIIKISIGVLFITRFHPIFNLIDRL